MGRKRWVPVLTGLLVVLAIGAAPVGSLMAQVQLGWIEGKVHTDMGEPFGAWVTLYTSAGNYLNSMRADTNLDGLFSFTELKPGVYELRVTEVDGYRPQRIFGVTVRPGARTLLDVKLQRGTALQEIGEPPVVTRTVIDLEAALAALRRELEELRNRVQALESRGAQPRR